MLIFGELTYLIFKADRMRRLTWRAEEQFKNYAHHKWAIA